MGALLVQLTDVAVTYGSRVAVRRVDLDVEHGRQLALLGPSGAGKSTLLHLLAGELHPSAGAVHRPGTPRIGMVFQQARLMPWLTVRDNLALGHAYAANADVRDAPLVDELLDLLGLTAHADAYPDQLSGGQAQRVALGRALAVRPDLLLLDEPFSALDPATRGELQGWLRRHLTERGLSSVVVTHDIDEALVLADDVVVLRAGGTVARRWSITPATNHVTAASHPLRAQVRAAYDEPAHDNGAPEPGSDRGRHGRRIHV
ncbi:ABC transporter ATP-binding protein [Arsenicicoccus cauae]|uniref:ABC transporter ATP-binding protein n=1 Tax=Arsenicicoccus cauae TaxID=2663847 RepID=UPI0025961804|nr:ATP-binding cassette domain-containing protein [uncultured Arsenicicoccus sp.]